VKTHVTISLGAWIALGLGVSTPVKALPTSVPACVGDCDASQQVTVDEVLVGVNIALGQQQVAVCPAFDRDASESLTVDELVSGVDTALNGCVTNQAEGPIISALTLARADDIIVEPIDFDALNRPIFLRPFGSGFSLIVEGRVGPNGIELGHEVFETAPFDPADRPDIEVIISSPLGDGSATVCDTRDDEVGGVPAAEPFGFHPRQNITDVINEMSCRVNGGARTNERDACTVSQRGNDFGFAFVSAETAVQYCLPFARAWALPPGDTVIAVRLLDMLGNPGEIAEVIVRIP
jgi:hypothetical protein